MAKIVQLSALKRTFFLHSIIDTYSQCAECILFVEQPDLYLSFKAIASTLRQDQATSGERFSVGFRKPLVQERKKCLTI